MKLMIASDIHGSAYYCQKLIDSYKKEHPDKLLLLGDILYHGPRNNLPRNYAPKKVIEMLNPMSQNIICVRGNCDAEVDQMVLDFSVMDTYKIINLDSLTFFATHGHHYNENKLPDISSDYILLNGHTHIPIFNKHQNYTYINVGSVSIPKENSPHTYSIYSDRILVYKDFCGKEYKKVVL